MLNKLFRPFEELSKSQNNLVILLWLTFILGWWVISSFVGTTHLFPTITQVFNGFVSAWNLGLMTHISSSILLFLQASLYSVIISCIVVYLSPLPVIKPFCDLISTFRFLPLVGISLYISIIIHNARNIQVTVLVIFMSLFLITSLLQSLSKKSIENEINHAKSIGCSRWEIILEVMIKGRFDFVIEAVRQNLAIIFNMLVVIELINTASGGLGYLIGTNQKNGSQGEVIALQIIILMIGKSIDYSLISLRRLFFRYSNF